MSFLYKKQFQVMEKDLKILEMELSWKELFGSQNFLVLSIIKADST